MVDRHGESDHVIGMPFAARKPATELTSVRCQADHAVQSEARPQLRTPTIFPSWMSGPPESPKQMAPSALAEWRFVFDLIQS